MPFGVHPPEWVFRFVVLGGTLFFLYFFVWVRGTLPRLRYDQLMSLGWKVLLPITTLDVLVTAVLVVTVG